MNPEAVILWRTAAGRAAIGAAAVDRLLADESIVLGGRALTNTASIARLAAKRLEQVAAQIDRTEAERLAEIEAQLCATPQHSDAPSSPTKSGIGELVMSESDEELARSIGFTPSAEGVVGSARGSAGLMALLLALLVAAVLTAWITRGSATDSAALTEAAPVSAAGAVSVTPRTDAGDPQ